MFSFSSVLFLGLISTFRMYTMQVKTIIMLLITFGAAKPLGLEPSKELLEVNKQISETSKNKLNDSKCECGVLDIVEPESNEQAILIEAPINVTCDKAGKENCIKLCSALALVAKVSGTQMLCSVLGHHNNLKASIYSRICDSKQWTFTGLTAPNDICCHESKVITCAS